MKRGKIPFLLRGVMIKKTEKILRGVFFIEVEFRKFKGFNRIQNNSLCLV